MRHVGAAACTSLKIGENTEIVFFSLLLLRLLLLMLLLKGTKGENVFMCVSMNMGERVCVFQKQTN